MLAKIDIAREFRNLRVHPVDAFKFSIYWQGSYYIDVTLAFRFTHGSPAFQMTSDAILYSMRKENCGIFFAFIDDFIIVSNRDDARRHFNKLSYLFDELGLPMNETKIYVAPIPPLLISTEVLFT